jgi:chromosome segregation protein
LENTASVVTRDGIWLGKHWLRVSKTQDSNSSIIKREKELSELMQQLQHDEQRSEELKTEVQAYKEQLLAFEANRDTLQREVNQICDQANKLITQLAVQRASRDRLAQRALQLANEQNEQQALLVQYHAELVEVRNNWQAAIAVMEQDEQRRIDLFTIRTSLRTALEIARGQANSDKEQVYQ